MKKYENFVSNLAVLGRAEQEDLDNEFIISGIIDKFFLQFELGWKLFKELLRYEGKQTAASGSPREIIKAAYAVYDFVDEEVWLSMLKARNDMTHIYDGAAAKQMVGRILEQYLPAFIKVQEALEERYGDLSKEDL
ncbi:MAG: nucleotidyltransferase [Lachnospiraceae bacterium]|jgi:nucleotidyltransferase substrate binding protein (TIGR01987 family)|nr:nucleotidyltransferase [Lachnospiraceae bacterium]